MSNLLKDFEVDAKNPSIEARQRWRSSVSIVKNRARRFRMVSNLDARSENQKKISQIQVFFNYRGEQLRYNFISHLSDAFERHQINFFVDKNEQRGKDFKIFFERIQESRIALAIFSTRYSESSWCMDELVKIKTLADQDKLQVIPIFYKVRARDVKKQTGEFGENFWMLARASSGDQIKKWKEALECISDKMGLSLGDQSSEADFVKEIVKEVQRVIASSGAEEEENQIGKKRRKVEICNHHVCLFARKHKPEAVVPGDFEED